MASYNPATPCCCGAQGEGRLCCISVTVALECPTLIVNSDPEDCGTLEGPVEYLTASAKFRYCVNSLQECNCDLLDRPPSGGGGGFGGGQTQNSFEQFTNGLDYDLIECNAIFHPDKSCTYTGPEVEQDPDNPQDPDDPDNPEDPDNPSNPCKEGGKLCPKYICGPCGPLESGCTFVEGDTPCPSFPNCELKPCCEDGPPQLCCCTAILNSCVTSAFCQECPEVLTSGTGAAGIVCTPVTSCAGCDTTDSNFSILVTTLCCSSCGLLGSTWVNKCEYQPGQPLDYSQFPCCHVCALQDQPGACDRSKCIKLCTDGPVSGAPLCPCPLGPVTLGGCFQQAQSSPYGTIENSAEGNYLKGLIYDPITGTYIQNTLLFFGYGMDQL